MKNIILLGAPGSGKGTLATELAPKVGIKHISTGDLLRDVVSSGSELGNEIKSYMESGDLVPDELIGKMIKEVLVSDDAKNGVLLDGFPRTVKQAEMLDEIMAEIAQKIESVFYLKVDLDEIVKRLVNRVSCKVCGKPYHLINFPPKEEGKCDDDGGELIKRADDNEETIQKRYATYIDKTQPLIDYYISKSLLKEVDSSIGKEETISAVLEQI